MSSVEKVYCMVQYGIPVIMAYLVVKTWTDAILITVTPRSAGEGHVGDRYVLYAAHNARATIPGAVQMESIDYKNGGLKLSWLGNGITLFPGDEEITASRGSIGTPASVFSDVALWWKTLVSARAPPPSPRALALAQDRLRGLSDPYNLETPHSGK